MILARVCGNLVNSAQEPGFDGVPIRIVQKVDYDGNACGAPFMVIDRIGANNGEVVLLETAMEASMGMNKKCAADNAIVAIVDEISG
jgi:microcompartment protein CcmK/EutM